MTGTTNIPTRPPSSSFLVRAWRSCKSVLVFLFVTFHLLVFLIRNPFDLWEEPINKWLKKDEDWGGKTAFPILDKSNRFTYKYVNLVGCEQRWVMFRPPMARGAPFLGVRYEFTDGSWEWEKSVNEPPEPASFFRIGGWQERKLEDYLLGPPKELDQDPDWPIWRSYARYAVRHWHKAYPDDPRELIKVVLLFRRIRFTQPDQPPGQYQDPYQEDLLEFHPDGEIWR